MPRRPSSPRPPGRPGAGPRAETRADVLAAVALGGMAGAAARYGVAAWLPGSGGGSGGGFPWATFVVNLSGSFLLGVLVVVLVERLPPTRLAGPFLATGVLGSFTTMSTYEVEVALLLDGGHPATALAYGAGSLLAGVALAYAGTRAARRLPARPPAP